MRGTSYILAAAALLGIGTLVTSGSAVAGGTRMGTGGLPTVENAWGFGYGQGPSFYGQYAPLAEDSYVFSYEYPVFAGRDVRAIAVDLTNSRFRHRPVAGPGIIYYRGQYPRPYRMNQYW
ncbi:hypothetical protein [Bradyrhizobium iriomotense]|uniref:hypothetical protein n=1 Tax=Bradyrhizobium iriomotense TaxID=441950 RepID=UPI001B8A867A|nr:hypothetical protein [Bradyrhizobium iriomotense]MBR0786873.1 hypothetical protein [Bradyrhizobium iriomotense]